LKFLSQKYNNFLKKETGKQIKKLVTLNRLLHTSTEDILVVDGDIAIFYQTCLMR